ncbi:unnamed protein product [Absidia cylindrospora]
MEANRPRRRTISSTTLNGSTIQNATTVTSSSTPPATTTSEGDNYFPPLQRPLSRKLSTASRRSMTASLSTPPSKTLSSASTATYARSSRRRHFSTATISIYRRPSSTLSGSAGTNKLASLFSLNRAAVIISRLEQWLKLVKCVLLWLEETAKLHLQLSRGYSQRHLPLFQMELQPDQTPAASTFYAGLRLLTTNVADAHHAFGGKLQQLHIPALLKFKRECKEKIRVLRNDHRLSLDELLRRAEQTKKCMDQLNKVCQSAENRQQRPHEKSTLSDPWLANLYVLRQLKREMDEENRLRHLMVPIQKETADFETRLLGTLKPAVQYCCEYLAPGVWHGDADEETAPFQLLMDRIVPDSEWQHFYQREEKELVDEQQVTKDYLNINYANKLHDSVVTLKKGTMQRYIGGVRIKFSDRLYVLSQGGYLHQFRMDDKVVPERSIYIPHSTISCLDDCTFEIRRPVNGASGGGGFTATEKSGSSLSSAGSDTMTPQRQKKVYIIKANNTDEMQSWCQILADMASGRLAVRRPRKFVRATMNLQQQQQDPSHEDLTKVEDEQSTDSLVSASRALKGYRHHFEIQPVAISTRSSTSSTPALPLTLSSSSTSSKDETRSTPSTSEHMDDGVSSTTSLSMDDDQDKIHPIVNTSTNNKNNLHDEPKAGTTEEPLDSNDGTIPSTTPVFSGDINIHPHASLLASSTVDGEEQAQTTMHDTSGPLDELEDAMVDHGDDLSDDSESTISSNESVSTVTRRYSLLPTSSNNQHYDHDDDEVSIYTQYDDAASHISSSRLSISTTTSTQYDDAASSLYFSSNMSTRSAGGSSMELDGYQHPMVIPDLDEQHA